MPMIGYMSRTQANFFFIGALAAVISWTSSASFMSHCNFKYFLSSCRSSTFNLRSYWLQWPFHKSHIVDSLFFNVFFTSHYFIFFSNPPSWKSLHPPQHCLFCHFQPYLWHCIFDRLIHMLHKCDCIFFLLKKTTCRNTFHQSLDCSF